MSGKLEVKSAKGRGSTFFFNIPGSAAFPNVIIPYEEPAVARCFNELSSNDHHVIIHPQVASISVGAISLFSESKALTSLLSGSLSGSLSASRGILSSATTIDNRSLNLDKPLHVLVVDDNLINLKIAERMLVSLGVTVDKATNGQQALIKYAEAVNLGKEFALVLMDVRMPLMDGYECTRQLRQHGVNIPIIATTASSLTSDHHCCIESGMTGILVKPFGKEDVQRILQTHCGH
jgi:CheY-like chemotaxis protein